MALEENISIYVENRLQEWADWFMYGDRVNIGYPKESFIAMIPKGFSICREKNYNRPILPTNESAEEIEKLIVEMAQQHRKMADALRGYYLSHEPTLRLKACACGISEARFKVLLAMGRQWLAGRLSLKKKYA